jgi:hypothetical protein
MHSRLNWDTVYSRPLSGSPWLLVMGLVTLLVATTGSGFVVAETTLGPVLVIGGCVGVVAYVFASRAGTTGVMMLLFGAAALIPVVAGAQGTMGVSSSTAVPTATIHGYDADTLRTIAIAALTLLAALTLGIRALLAASRLTLLIAGGLLAMAVLGVVATAFTAQGGADYLKAASQAGGQPFIYLLLFLELFAVLRSDPKAPELLVRAWCVAVLIEMAVVVVQLGTGAAYDAFRGFTRAQGTMGADFLGIFAVLGAFGGTYLRLIARTPRDRWLGAAAIGAGVFMLVASVSRGSLVGLAVGVATLMLTGSGSQGGRRLLVALGVIALAAVSIYLGQGLWKARLDSSTTSTFDRPSTWVSGARIASDNPLVGVGPAHVATVVSSSPRYSDTPFGVSTSNPHDAWLFVTDAEGIPYGILLVVVSALFVVALRRAPKSSSTRVLAAAIVSAGVVFLINNLFNHPEIMLYVLLAGALVVTSDRHGRRESRVAANSSKR